MTESIDSLVANVPAFAHLKPDEQKLLAMVLKVETHEPGTVIFDEGERGHSCYFLAEGEVDIEKNVGEDEMRSLTTLRPHSLFGQIALIDSGKRSARAQARTHVLVMRLDRQDFDTLFSSGSHFAFRFQFAIARIAVRQLREANRKLSLLLTVKREPQKTGQRHAVLEEFRDILAMSDAQEDSTDLKWLG